jgi:hypothetical protein
MKPATECWIVLAACLLTPGWATAADHRELTVHLAQANNDSPYAFVRAKFNPGEVADPWAVRFFDDKGTEISYFVWDSITWKVAQEGRADWGRRYALVNHAPGDAPEVVEARAQKLKWTRKNLPELGEKLDAQEQAARKAGDSVCAALYLLRHRVAALGKERVTLRIYPERQVEPKHRQWKGEKVDERIAAQQGALEFRNLPDRLGVVWKGKELFRSAGFQAGDWSDTVSHADPARPFALETWEGIITKVSLTAQTKGRRDGSMDWQCSSWLFPEGSYVALEGFSFDDPAGYVGGSQKLTILEAEGDFTERRAPLWETPWWLHQAGDRGFVATHLFYATPLTIGFGNNPFTVNAEGPDKDPKAVLDGKKLVLSWSHRLDDPAIQRLMAPQPLPRPGNPRPAGLAKPLTWRPKVDWLYRQYLAGVGETAETAEGSLRAVLGAAAGWIDRPVSEEDIAALLVAMMPRIANGPETAEIGLLKIVPAVLKDDKAAIRETLRRDRDLVARTDYYIKVIKGHVERGGKPSEGRKKDDADGTPREGWTGNPCYHAALMPCYVRVLEHFELPFRQKEYREAILRYADFSLELLGGNPIDFDKLNTTFQGEWPSRVVPMIPLMLHAYTLKPEEKYSKAAKLLFQDLMRLEERNPHGYYPTWTWTPKADKYDTVYNPVSNERGIAAYWSDGMLDLIGRKEASRFVAGQARWFVFSGQLLDTLEIDNATAIRASTHGGHTNIRNQIGIYLYDDFDFYRGLLGDLVSWSAAACQVPDHPFAPGTDAYRSLELSNGGSSMLRWALDIRPGSKWPESKVERLEKTGFRLRAWNRLPQAKPAVKVAAKEVGLKAEGEALQVQLNGPAFRQPAEFEVTWTEDRVLLKASKPAKIRLAYRVLRPGWPGMDKPVLQRRLPGDRTEVVDRDVVWEDNSVEWQAVPGEYELRKGPR